MDAQSHPDSRVIEALGGPGKVAQLCRVTSQAVSQWKRTGIPEPRRMYLQVLRPDVFKQPAEVADNGGCDAR